MKLRDYQKKDVKKVKKLFTDKKSIILGGSTGYGKSAVIHNMVKKELKKGGRVLVLLPRRKLVRQIKETLKEFVPSIVMGADSTYVKDVPLYVASIQTVNTRVKRYGKGYLGDITLIIQDECHLFHMTKSTEAIRKLYWGKAKWLGLSATPIDGRGYRLEGYEYTHYKNQAQDLIESGWLTDVEVLVEDAPKGLEDVGLTGGDYNEGQLEQLMMDSARVSNVFKIWKKYAMDRKTMIFAVSIAHADMIKSDFDKAGIPVAIAHSNIDEDEEELNLQLFKDGEVNVIINVSKLIAGYDEPSVDCLIMARPSKTLTVFLQSIGRGLRLYPGKKECMVLDLAGICNEHGYPTMRRDFNMIKPPPRKKLEEELKETECFECGFKTQLRNCTRDKEETKRYTKTTWLCPNCNAVMKEDVLDHKQIKKLKKLENYTDISGVKNTDVEKMVITIAKEKGYKQGWVNYVARDYKKYPTLKDEMKLIYKKWKLGMIKLDTALSHINKARKKYET